MKKENVVHSSIGEVIDVATPSSHKLRILGFLWSLVALAMLVLINYLVIQALSDPDPILSTQHRASLVGALLLPLIGWFALSAAVQSFHGAASEERYLRAGPGGVSICLPDDQANAFRFSFRTIKLDLPWEQIKTWYPYVQTINGIPTDRAVVFETVQGKKYSLKTHHFTEREKQITSNITRAKLMRLSVTPTADVTSPVKDGNEAAALPPAVGDLSITIKKKKEPVKEIDLREVHVSQRGASIERIADLLLEKTAVICPSAAGFKVSKKYYQPFKEWKHVFGIRLFVRRGLLDGYEIQIEPNDSESRKLTISMCPSSLAGDIRKYVSIALGAGFVLYSLKWAGVISHWLGDFSRLTPIVFLVLFLVALALSTGIIEVPIRLLRLLFTNKQSAEAHKHEMTVGIREMAV